MEDVFQGRVMENNWSCDTIPGGEGEPAIEFTSVPAKNSHENLKGRVYHVDPSVYRVAVYIEVSGGWWTKPYWDQPATWINCNGEWVCDITTGGNDASATRIAAYLIPAAYDPPLSRGGSSLRKEELEANAVDWLIVTR
jgi:hypothetical protein